ncbi:MAG: AgmX/PglI C-terminal domain-containing protein [Bdellovibrionales bacterium]|nr:AgmX/PglI C-terminal domain-containing protein [Bdellovibrionales bacterium]
MSLSHLQIPSDPHKSELYFDPSKFTVAFRDRKLQSSGAKNLLRVVVQYYGEIIEDQVFEPNTKIYAGSRGKNALAVPIKDLKSKDVFIHYTSTKSIKICLPLNTDGVIQTRDQIVRLQELPSQKATHTQIFEFGHETKGIIDLDHIQIYFEEVERSQKPLPIPFVEKFGNKELYRWLALSILLHLLLLFLLYVVGGTVEEEKTLEDLPEKYQKILVQPLEVKPYEPVTVKSLSPGTNPKETAAKMIKKGDGREGEGARAPGAEGRRGRSTASKPVERPSMDKVKNAGVLSFFTKQQSKDGGFDDLVDGSVQDVAQNLQRTGAGRFGLPDETKVKAGKGLAGDGSGGGGETASIGRGLATKGRGGGAKGDGLADFGTGDNRRSVVAKIDQDEVSVIGTLTQAQINDIIMKYWGQIQYCYEREIIREPTLAGKIWVRFTIGTTGRVTQASIEKTTMNSPPVENCVTAAFRRIPFPSPGGSIVEAVYPINFKVAG